MQPDATDAYLVERAQEGYLDAFSELVARHSLTAYRVALRMVGHPQEAEDVAQDALIAAWQALPRFKAEANFSTWLYRIVTRTALNRVTRHRHIDTRDLLGEPADTAGGPFEHVQRDQTIDAVTNAVTALPPSQRVALVLHHFEGLSIAEVARITGSTESAVTSHLYRARRTLATTLADWR